VRTQSTLCESGKIPETREPFRREDPGVPAGLRATPRAKAEDKKEMQSE
jgi:hypothetical protein